MPPHALQGCDRSHGSAPAPPSMRRKREWVLRRTKWASERDIEWHGIQPGQPDWSETSRLVAYTQVWARCAHHLQRVSVQGWCRGKG
eukprot:364007-Chlamydomonas_euryale.AAC.6